MNRASSIGERCVALFLAGLVLFNPPLLSAFTGIEQISGIPVLFFYVFTAWAGLIVMTMLAVSRRSQQGPQVQGTTERDRPATEV